MIVYTKCFLFHHKTTTFKSKIHPPCLNFAVYTVHMQSYMLPHMLDALLVSKLFFIVCGRVQSGDIPMSELQKISDNNEQMKRLCAAVIVQGDKKESGQLSFRAVQSALHQRLQEFRVFDQHRSCLYTFPRFSQHFSLIGIIMCNEYRKMQPGVQYLVVAFFFYENFAA